MKLLNIWLFCLSIFIFSCKNDLCKDSDCGIGECENGQCKCPFWLEGENCEQSVRDRYIGKYEGFVEHNGTVVNPSISLTLLKS